MRQRARGAGGKLPPRRDHGRAYFRPDLDRVDTQGRESHDVLGPDRGSGLEEELSGLEIFPAKTHVLRGTDRSVDENLDQVAAPVQEAPDVLLLDHRVEAVRGQRRSRHDLPG